MKKYYVVTSANSCTLAVEKYLHGYILTEIAKSVVSVERLNDIVDMINREQGEYFRNHRGKSVEVRLARRPGFSTIFIFVGAITLSLVEVNREFV